MTMMLAWPIKGQTGVPSVPADCPPQAKFAIDNGDPQFGVQCPIPLPQGARAVLAEDRSIRQTMRQEGIKTLPKNWFTATYVHLGPVGEKDLLVLGNQGPLLGANVAPIWVLRPSGPSWKIILAGAPALGINVLASRSGGYYDLEIGKATSDQAYVGLLRFDGDVYRLAEGHWSPIK